MLQQDLNSLKGPWPVLRLSSCWWFALKAMDTWGRIQFVRSFKKGKAAAGRKGLPITEETITENLLYELIEAQSRNNGFVPDVLMYQAEREPKEGNDIDLFVRYPWGTVRFMVQSKLVYDTLRYQSIKHDNKNGEQIDLLLAASAKLRAVPLYLFYNHVPGHTTIEKWCNEEWDETQYGCTVANARRIANQFYPAGVWTIPSFDDLHSGGQDQQLARPWITLVCCEYNSLTELLARFGDGGNVAGIEPQTDWPEFGDEVDLVVPSVGDSENGTIRYRRMNSTKELAKELPVNDNPEQFYPRFIATLDVR